MTVPGSFAEIVSTFWLVGAVFLRIGSAFFFAPGYGEQSVSIRVRLAVALAFSAVIAPVQAPFLPESPPGISQMIEFASLEILIGLFIGIIARGMIFLLEKTGVIISQSISLSQMLGNVGTPMPVISHLLVSVGLALIFSTSLANQMLYSLALSYNITWPEISDVVSYFAQKKIEFITFITGKSVKLASGVIALIFVYNLFIGFSNKAMPQLMVSFIGIPFVSLMSIMFLQQHGELLLEIWQNSAASILMLPFESQ